MFNIENLKILQTWAARSPNREICGVITKDNQIIPIRNVATLDHHFVMSKPEYLTALKHHQIQVIYHSHTNNDPTPSEADRKACSRIGIDYLIVTPTKHFYLEHNNAS